jgi:hypothetical protein
MPRGGGMKTFFIKIESLKQTQGHADKEIEKASTKFEGAIHVDDGVTATTTRFEDEREFYKAAINLYRKEIGIVIENVEKE